MLGMWLLCSAGSLFDCKGGSNLVLWQPRACLEHQPGGMRVLRERYPRLSWQCLGRAACRRFETILPPCFN